MRVVTELLNFQNETVERMKLMEKKCDGGFLLSDPGLGKSLSLLKTIVTQPKQKNHITLIVCPAGVLYNWRNEIEKHTKDINIYFYYGNKRDQYNINQIKRVDVILTTYTTITRDLDKSLFKLINFGRIVLDEAHYIRNCQVNVSKGLLRLSDQNLNAKKWIVTATPFFNSYMDFYSYFKFLGLEGVDSKKVWNNTISNDLGGLKKLNEWIKKYSIKYCKENVLKDLQSKNEKIIKVEFSEIEREFYDSLKTYSTTRIIKIIKQIKRFKQFDDMKSMRKLALNNVLTLILRLKQSCNSPLLTVSNMKRLSGIKSIQHLNVEMRRLQSNVEEDCPICYDTLADTVAEPCGHRCCRKCWYKLFDNGTSKCPVCRRHVNELSYPKEPETSETSEESESDIEGTFMSSKIKKVLAIIKEKIKKGEKVVVVSQWVKFLDIIHKVFDKYNVKYITLKGNIPMKRRFEYITQFENDPSIKVCFVSMLSSAEGINLVSANNMIIVESWWNNAKITQVMDRIHRIGQKRNVNIYKLQVTNTIEERIQELVDKKYKIDKLITNKWTVGDDYNTDWMKSIIKLIVCDQ